MIAFRRQSARGFIVSQANTLEQQTPQWRQSCSRTFQHSGLFVELGNLSFSRNREARAQKAKRNQFLSRRDVDSVSVNGLDRYAKVKVWGIQNVTMLVKEGIVLPVAVKLGHENNDLVVVNLTQEAQQPHGFQPDYVISRETICYQSCDLFAALRTDRPRGLIAALFEKLDRCFDPQHGSQDAFIEVRHLIAQPAQVVFYALNADARNDLRHQFVQCPADTRQRTDPNL